MLRNAVGVSDFLENSITHVTKKRYVTHEWPLTQLAVMRVVSNRTLSNDEMFN